ncbi:MAG: T9SS type A sorting domain-containing protein [Bacteroidia bacterium]|nr:T9SS type A sorting domain-containing protein [Bacteroidia bacterium]
MPGKFFTKPEKGNAYSPLLTADSHHLCRPLQEALNEREAISASTCSQDTQTNTKKKLLYASRITQSWKPVLPIPKKMFSANSVYPGRFLLTLFIAAFFHLIFPNTLGAQTIVQSCELTPYASNDHAFWLNAIPGDSTRDYVFDTQGGLLNYWSDSTLQITGRIVNQRDPNRLWDVDMWLINPRTYAEWTALGRDLKNGGGVDSTDWQNWMFYELDNSRSRMIGVAGSAFDGDVINILHRPSNLNFGFQIGIGANDKNGNFGISGWFDFDGSYSGRGDINANIECDTLPPPPPVCSVMIDTFYASCKSDSSFEMNISFTGIGSNFQISDDQGTTVVGGLSSGTYTFGEYFNSTDVRLTVSDPNFPNCTETTFPVTLDCTPVPVCDLVVDSIYTQCMTDSTFSVVVSISGTSNLFLIMDNLGNDPLDSLSAGTYTYGNYPNDSLVSILVQDWAVFNCFVQADSLTDNCSNDSSSTGMAVSPDMPEVYVDPVFPNPVSQNTQIRVRSEESEMLTFAIRVVDAMGRTRQVNQRMIREGLQEFNLPLNDLQPGLYFVSFGIGGQVVSAQRILVIE